MPPCSRTQSATDNHQQTSAAPLRLDSRIRPSHRQGLKPAGLVCTVLGWKEVERWMGQRLKEVSVAVGEAVAVGVADDVGVDLHMDSCVIGKRQSRQIW